MSSNPQQQAVDLIAGFIAFEVGDPDLMGIMRDQARRLVEEMTEAGLLVTPQASSAERSEEEVCRCAPTPSALGQDSEVYIRLSNRPVNYTTNQFNDSVNVDMDDYDEPVGVEILGAIEVTVDGLVVSGE